jgi:hypothetical protein
MPGLYGLLQKKTKKKIKVGTSLFKLEFCCCCCCCCCCCPWQATQACRATHVLCGRCYIGRRKPHPGGSRPWAYVQHARDTWATDQAYRLCFSTPRQSTLPRCNQHVSRLEVCCVPFAGWLAILRLSPFFSSVPEQQPASDHLGLVLDLDITV